MIQAGGLPTAHCPGSPTNPQAAPGYFCLYVGYADQVSGSGVDVYGTDASSEFRWGGVVYINENSTSYAEAAGTWAVTAP